MVEILRPNAMINYGSASNDIWTPYKECLEFYKRLGYLSFYGNEIYGIDPLYYNWLKSN